MVIKKEESPTQNKKEGERAVYILVRKETFIVSALTLSQATFAAPFKKSVA